MHRHAEPHEEQHHHRAERDGARGLLAPDEEVEHEQGGGDGAGVEGGGEHGDQLPLGALECLVGVRGAVARRHAHQHEGEQRGGEQAAW